MALVVTLGDVSGPGEGELGGEEQVDLTTVGDVCVGIGGLCVFSCKNVYCSIRSGSIGDLG